MAAEDELAVLRERVAFLEAAMAESRADRADLRARVEGHDACLLQRAGMPEPTESFTEGGAVWTTDAPPGTLDLAAARKAAGEAIRVTGRVRPLRPSG